ncbi:MAG: FtsX-like permease family protein [Ferruginibacter sp.]
MIKNYFKIAIRFFMRNKTFGIINVTGLATGTLCCLYILLYVMDQYSYDRHHANANNIYRITSLLKTEGDKINKMATASPPVAPAMKKDISEVMQFTRVVGAIGVSQHLLRYNEKSFYEKEAVFADSTFFDVFNYHFTNGNPSKALAEPYSVVLLKETSDKLFGNSEPIGKRIEIDNSYGKHDFIITGVVDESLGKSHIHANIFIAMNSGGIGDFVRSSDAWAGQNFTNSYVKLYPSANAAAVERKLPAFLKKYGQDQLQSRGMQKELHLQPVTSIHTTPGYDAEMGKTVSPSFLTILLLIAGLIQIIACINFMNLSTARASKRAREVGVRKVIGAGRKDLIKQFIGESVLLSLAAMLLTLPLLWIALPYLNEVTKADIHFSFIRDYRIGLMLAGLVLTTGLLAGSYPAFYLSAFSAVKVMKGNFSNHISVMGIRKSLIVFQFVLSIVLITGIIVIYNQLHYINNRDLGFEKDQKLIFTFHTGDSKKQMETFANSLRQLAEVKAVSKANNYPGQPVFNDVGLFLKGGNMQTAKNAQFMKTDEFFAKAIGIKIFAGRDFRLNDSGKVLINETYLKKLGLAAKNAEGTKLYFQQSEKDPIDAYEIAGVMKDFNYNSLHENVNPLMLMYNKSEGGLSHLIVAVNSNNYKTLLNKIESSWRSYLPAVPFEYNFLDEEVQKQYDAEITLGRIINSFAVMAILISCLGLFGLSAFTAEQRTKEIGIRKVLGAGSFNLTALLSKDFLKLVIVAIVIATPLSWWAADKWLQDFAYRINISGWIFFAAGTLALLIALLTVSFHTIRASVANPVESLRTE